MKTAISIPDSLFQAADRFAKRLGISRSELFQRAVRTFLQHNKQECVTEALDKLYGTGGENSELDPMLSNLQGASIAREDW